MGQELFSHLVQKQDISHCGASSLSACMWLLGLEASQRRVAKAAGKPWAIYREGLDEVELRKAAGRLGVACTFVTEPERARGKAFSAALREHLARGLPAIIIVSDLRHWVAVVGFLEDRRQFVIMDPNDDAHAYNFWSERTLLARAWNRSNHLEEPSQYFAILTRRKDGGPARWRVSRAFLELCATGSAETAEQMARDLQEMVRRATPERLRAAAREPLSVAMERQQRLILDSVHHWAAHEREGASAREVASLFRDYRTVAEAAGLEAPRGMGEAALVAQMTALVTTYAWKGEL